MSYPRRLLTPAVLLAAVLATAGCSSGSTSAAKTASTPIASTSSAQPSPTTVAACQTFRTRIKDVRAHRSPLLTMGRLVVYRHATRLSETDTVRLTRVAHASTGIAPTPGSTLGSAAMLRRVVNRWGQHFGVLDFRKTVGQDRESMDLRSPGITTVPAGSRLVWFRGWDTVHGSFRWSSCDDGATRWHTGRFHTYGVSGSGSADCDGGTTQSVIGDAAMKRWCS